MGGPGSEETLARPVKFDLENAALSPERFGLLRERVYFGVSSEIYRQIRSGVEQKISLLPTKRFRKRAFFREAEDYARSATVDAYADARRLYDAGFDVRLVLPKLLGWADRRKPSSPEPAGRSRKWRRIARALSFLRRWERLVLNSVWPPLTKNMLLEAEAAVGYSNVLLYGAILSALSGRGENEMFEARRLAAWAIGVLEGLPARWRRRSFGSDPMFGAHVAEALAWAQLGSRAEARARLRKARQLNPSKAEEDPRFLFAWGEAEARLLSSIPRFRRAVELDERFEIAQFELATSWEFLWRTRARLEQTEADMILEEYDRVLNLNPSNIGAWANRGYMLWLLNAFDKAERAFINGIEYKDVRPETEVDELEYGLTRIAAETGHMDDAYRHYTRFVASISGQTESVARFPLEYYFFYISGWLLERFRSYREAVERELEKDPLRETRERRAVHAFVLNDWGEALLCHWRRSGEEEAFNEALGTFTRASELNPQYVMPHYNLATMALRGLGEDR